METTTPFDLNQALQQWRANLQTLGSFRAEDLAELEGHLRESISLLQARELSLRFGHKTRLPLPARSCLPAARA